MKQKSHLTPEERRAFMLRRFDQMLASIRAKGAEAIQLWEAKVLAERKKYETMEEKK